MARIRCKECGNRVSQKAKSCPSCGAPLKTNGAWGSPTLLVLLVGFVTIVIVGGYSILHAPQASRQASKKPDYVHGANRIIAEETPLAKSMNEGFYAIDRTLANDPSRDANAVLSDLAMSSLVVNKLLDSWSEEDLIKTYEAWCSVMKKTSHTEFPKFIKACQTDAAKNMTDQITKKHTK